jgi:uncharacterized surface protein with fasciclin (FAS1) repeats
MKTFSRIKVIFITLIFSSFIISCDDNETKPSPTITEIAQTNADLSILVQALVKTKLDVTFKEAGSYTVLAPTNKAFTDFLRTTTFATINDVPDALLMQILMNHVIVKSLKSAELSSGYYKSMAKATGTTNELSLFVVNVPSVSTTINGTTKLTANTNIMASNGVIHIVDRVITLPTVVSHVTANPSLSFLASAITAPVAATLNGVGPFTIFAPSDLAFANQRLELAITPANLPRVINYHVVNGMFTASSLTEGQKLPTLLTPQTFDIQLTGGAKIKDNANRISNIIVTNVQCNNGVIHVIDRVLFPTL